MKPDKVTERTLQAILMNWCMDVKHHECVVPNITQVLYSEADIVTVTKSNMHETIDHATEYVRGNVHTNGIENFWSLFKRALRGTYVNIDSEHLFRYLDEQTFRFNNRKTTDSVRFALVLHMVTGKRITYDQLIDNEKYKQLKLWGKV